MQDPPRRLHETLASVVASGVNVITAGRYSAPKGQDYPPHYHPVLEVVVFHTGQIQCVVSSSSAPVSSVDEHGQTFEVSWNGAGERVITTRPGMVLVMPPHLIHADHALTAYSHHYVLIELPKSGATLDEPLTFMDDLDRSVERLVSAIAREWQTCQSNQKRMLELLVAQLQIICERLENDPAPSSAEQLVRRAERLLEESFTSAQSIAEVANQLNVSPSALRSHFANLRDYSPKEYQQRLRLNRALELVRTSSLSLEDIAGLTGYDSASHLSRHVKGATGSTPGQFRSSE